MDNILIVRLFQSPSHTEHVEIHHQLSLIHNRYLIDIPSQSQSLRQNSSTLKMIKLIINVLLIVFIKFPRNSVWLKSV
jgi:hypothetical protein